MPAVSLLLSIAWAAAGRVRLASAGVPPRPATTERSLRTEEHTAALVAEVQSSLSRQFSSPAVKRPDTVKRTRSNLQQDRLARSEQA